MNDDVLPPDTPGDQLEAVNAVLDGLATDDQRALVDASPQLTQLLDEFQANRRAAAQVQVPDQARELHIAAALAAFDDLHVAGVASLDHTTQVAGIPAAAPINVVSLARHRRVYRTLLGAAAAVVLVVGGVAALSSQSDSDQQSAATAPDAKVGGDEATTLDAPAPELAATAADSAADSATPSGEASTALTQDSAAPMLTDAPSETAAAAETSAAPRSTIGSIDVGGAEPRPVIADQDALKSYVAAPPPADDAQAAPVCGPAASDDLGNVSYQGIGAVVVRDPDTGLVQVYALDDCRLLTTLQT